MKKYILYTVAICILAIWSCSEDTIDEIGFGKITGKVISKITGEPLQNAKISTSPSSNVVFTDAQGNFVLNNVLADNYSVQAELQSFATGFESAVVTQGNTVNISFELGVATVNNKPPTKPILITPEDNATEVPLEVNFVWTASDPNGDDLTYLLQLRNGTTNDVRNFENLSDTTLVVDNLQLGTNYFWQVSASDDVNEPISSLIGNFKTTTLPNNPYFFVKNIGGNNVIYSGNDDGNVTQNETDIDVLPLTSEGLNSFRPRKNNDINKIAFIRTVGGNNQLFTMNIDGSNVQQVTSTIPIAGFRNDQIGFSWAQSGSKLYYPNFDKLYSINPNGGGATEIYRTTDGSLISEVAVSDFDADLVLIKTNNINGYNVRIFTVNISTDMTQDIILQNEMGAAGSIDITANADQVLYSRDISGSQNSIYRLFASRMFIYNIALGTVSEIETDVVTGQNDFDARFSPSEGGVIFTRAASNVNSQKSIYQLQFGVNIDDNQLFTQSFMPDWE